MKPDLDTLNAEIQHYVDEKGFVLFHSYSRLSDTTEVLHWDTSRYPDYRMFLDVAARTGARMIVYHHRDFTADYLEDALARLEEADLPREEKRDLDQRVRALRVYEGFTCALEISFDFENRIYMFDLRTDWYDELLDILEEIEESFAGAESSEEGPLGGYFSRN